LSYNGNQIIEANLTSENPVPIEAGQLLQFTYSVHWKETKKPFVDRFNRYLEYDFFEHKIHWFSMFNSIMMVLFLCGLVALILLRTLKNDFARYARDEDLDLEGIQGLEDSGWKQVHGDVFRAPQHLVLFSAFYGTGWQLLFLVLGVILYAMAGPILHGNMYEDRGEMVSTFIVCYALSSAIGGFASGSYYRYDLTVIYAAASLPQYGLFFFSRQFFSTARGESSTMWQRAMIGNILLFPVLVAIVTMFLNMIAVHYESISTVPLSVLLKMAAIWLLVAMPLSVFGTIFGRHWMVKSEFPCRVNSVARSVSAVSFSILAF
jgi:transmembrane 9 superfamily protein 3